MNTIGWSNEEIARNVAEDLPDGAYVNLGIGLPELVANYIPEGREIIIHTENGLLGVGPSPSPNEEDYELINAGKKPVTAIKGASFFHHADSFAMIRGGHLDYTILGAYQVNEKGDLANWSTGNADDIPAVGGAMDLVQGVKNVFVMMRHTTKDGKPKIVKECTYPLTGKGVVTRIYTELAILEVTKAGLKVIRLAPHVNLEYLMQHTDAHIII
ncbi:MAG: 3-oxoacid CoA-transferase subunit B [Bacteroidales bacterium]|nr:3-oxoacid CoA-transferase subunit B [Bacteroidales bacterium]